MKRELLILIAAALLGAAAVIFNQIRISSIENELRSQISNRVGVCFLKEAAGAQSLLTQEMLEEKEVPEAFRHPQSVLWKDHAQIVGQRLRLPLQAGQPILWSDLAESSKRSIRDSILPGRGVVTIPIDLVGGVGGLISPGARIDLIGVFNKLPATTTETDQALAALAPQPGTENSSSRLLKTIEKLKETVASLNQKQEFHVMIIARDLGVFAVGTRTQMDTPDSGAPRGGYGTISFDVPRNQQLLLIMALQKIETEGGRFFCVLRASEGGSDDEAGQAAAYSSADFLKLLNPDSSPLGGAATAPAAPKPAPKTAEKPLAPAGK